jgi:CRISPR/Cas system CSM-associated protein Csm3 (group 7 of RAMP superfamily)
MLLQGKLFVESPIYRGNARKTLFTRDGDGTQRLVSLAGEIAGTAQALMDAFIGKSRDGRNIGLLNQLWHRLYKSPLPEKLITKVECNLGKECYPRDRFFDLRMGIKLDEDRWAAEANANYKMETLFRNSVFDLKLYVYDELLKQNDNQARLFYLLEELREGRFWFGAGKSKGLGKCRLEMELPFSAPQNSIGLNSTANHLSVSMQFNTLNPILVGWNWGKLDPEIPAFAAIEGRLLVEAMRNIPDPIRNRLEIAIGGPILNPKEWKKKLAEYLPRVIAIILRENSIQEGIAWILPKSAIDKLSKGKFPLSKKILDGIEPLCDKPFADQEAAKAAITEAMGKKANLANRVLEHLSQQTLASEKFDSQSWKDIATSLGLNIKFGKQLETQFKDEEALFNLLKPECEKILPQLYQQVDRQVKMLQSDAWIDMEIANREDHSRIKQMIMDGKITERDWNQPTFIPEGIKSASWKEFQDSHANIQFRFLTNSKNLEKSIINDKNHIAFLKSYRSRTRQELSQPFNTDFRAGGPFNREISKAYGKPYDTLFMRMLSWSPSNKEGVWEIYIPGSTIKGAFRKRASQILKTLWGETPKTTEVLNRIFGTQGKRGLVFFSDAYLADPEVPKSSWCAMDSVKMDPATAQPIEEAKADYLFAYGENLSFQLRLDLQDVAEQDREAFSLLSQLIQDFHQGEIPLGGEKTNGMGWVQAEVTALEWRSAQEDGVSKKLFGNRNLEKNGIWHTLQLQGDAVLSFFESKEPVHFDANRLPKTPPKAAQGFISHRSFGGFCGILSLEGEVLTPISVSESGEPSFRVVKDGEHVNGWDFFSIAPAEASLRGDEKRYALPAKSIRGMVRHIYSKATNFKNSSPDLSKLNPVDSLFGWVGAGQNQAIAGRFSFNFGVFDKPELAWFKIPYPYGNWQFLEDEWKNIPKTPVKILQIGDDWRYFPHAPLAPIVQKIDNFEPDTAKASYMRAILPGSKCHFKIRFWNLLEEELQRLIWCLALEEGLAHKMGKARYLGFGSLKLNLLNDSYLINWENRYAGKAKESWQTPIKAADWINPKIIANYDKLHEALNAKQI